MTRPTKRTVRLREARKAKRQKLEATNIDLSTTTATHEPTSPIHEAHWEGLSESEEESDVEISEPEDNISEEGKNAFERLSNANLSAAKFSYQKGPTLSNRQQRRNRATQRDLQHAATTYSQPLSQFFSSISSASSKKSTPTIESQDQLRQAAIKDLEKKLRSKKTILTSQNLVRHQAVLALLYTTKSRKEGETREELSLHASRGFGKGVYFARKLVEWEGTWIRERKISEGKRGCTAKISSWFNDEGVQMAVREWCAGAGDRKFFRKFYFCIYIILMYLNVNRYHGIWSCKGSWRLFGVCSSNIHCHRTASRCRIF